MTVDDTLGTEFVQQRTGNIKIILIKLESNCEVAENIYTVTGANEIYRLADEENES